MSTTQTDTANTGTSAGVRQSPMKLEVVVIPVSDVDRSKEFYAGLGWRLDADIAAGDKFRVVQFTPPGSGCSIQFGKGVTEATPGSARHLELVVSDIEAARQEMTKRGVQVTETFHGSPFSLAGRIAGRDPDGQSYGSYAVFEDPDGNEFVFQEITQRLPGRLDPGETKYASATDLADAMRRASVAHGAHEQRIGAADENWPDWYAAYMVAEQSGQALPV